MIDLGLRLDDIEGLETESVYHRESRHAISANLHANGATEDEIEFLLHRRVELQRIAVRSAVAFIERKLAQHGIEKVVPDNATLAAAYRRMRRLALLQARINEALVEFKDEPSPVPDDLLAQIEERLIDDPTVAAVFARGDL